MFAAKDFINRFCLLLKSFLCLVGIESKPLTVILSVKFVTALLLSNFVVQGETCLVKVHADQN